MDQPRPGLPKDLKPLTALRFFAAVWVVLYHYWPSLQAVRPPVVAKGYLGVELFFVLSGFILAHVYLEPLGRGRFSYRGFLWARLARIYPVHLATLTLMAVLVLGARSLGAEAGARTMVLGSLPGQLLLVQAWGLAPGGGWNHPSWSISAEWFAYLAFPVLGWPIWRCRHRPLLAVGCALALFAATYAIFPRLAGFPLTQATLQWGALRIVPCFLLGAALHLGWTAGWLARRRLSGACAVASLAALLAATWMRLDDSWSVLCCAGIILSLAASASAGGRGLTGGLWVYLGEVSFSLYMVCIPWQVGVEAAVHRLGHVPGATLPWPLWLAMVGGVAPVAMAVHHLVERPARDAMRRSGPPLDHGRERAVRRPGLVEPEFVLLDP